MVVVRPIVVLARIPVTEVERIGSDMDQSGDIVAAIASPTADGVWRRD
jgi:hypothetical protein